MNASQIDDEHKLIARYAARLAAEAAAVVSTRILNNFSYYFYYNDMYLF